MIKLLVHSSLLFFSFVFTGCSKSDTNSAIEVDNNSQANWISSEPYYKYLWHIDSKNSSTEEIEKEVSTALNDKYIISSIDKNADINILDAWKITKGKDVIVAVIDDGADIEHEDLQANILLKYNADLDNDNVVNSSNDITYSSHGNTCAGFIASPINGHGIIGTAPESKLIIIRQDESDDIKTIRAFEYAKNNGAKVISCSWGTENVSEAIVSELKSLYDAGITVLFASGNDGKSFDADIYDESEVEWVIGVGASGENNDVTSYSNYGENIDFLAPGGDDYLSIGILGLDDTGNQGSTYNYNGLVSDSYAFASGTSFSTPVAAGVVALMYSVNPNITPLQVREILVKTADKIGTTANYNENGFDEKRANGKINALNAVLNAQSLNK